MEKINTENDKPKKNLEENKPWFSVLFEHLSQHQSISYKGIMEDGSLCFCVDVVDFEKSATFHPPQTLGLYQVSYKEVGLKKHKRAKYIFIDHKKEFFLIIYPYYSFIDRYYIILGSLENSENGFNEIFKEFDKSFSDKMHINKYLNYVKEEILSGKVRVFYDPGLNLLFSKEYIGIDRRLRKQTPISQYSFWGKRIINAPGLPNYNYYVDKLKKPFRQVLLIIAILSLVDAIFTINFISTGRFKEVNPVMAWIQEFGSFSFLISKIALTVITALMLAIHQYFKGLWIIFWTFLFTYLCLDLYYIYLWFNL